MGEKKGVDRKSEFTKYRDASSANAASIAGKKENSVIEGAVIKMMQNKETRSPYKEYCLPR